MKAFQGRGRRTDLGLCCVPPAPRVISRSALRPAAVSPRRLPRGSLSVPGGGRGLLVLCQRRLRRWGVVLLWWRLRGGGSGILRETTESLRVMRGPPFRLRGPSFAEARARSPVLVEFGVQSPLGGIALVGLQHSLYLLYVDLVAREEFMQDADEVGQGPRFQQLRPFHPVGLWHPPSGRLQRTPAAGWTPDTPRTRDPRDPPH